MTHLSDIRETKTIVLVFLSSRLKTSKQFTSKLAQIYQSKTSTSVQTDNLKMDDKKTWSDIERAVYRSRLQQYQFSSFVPSHFTFYKNILIFLGIPPLGDTYTNENTLVYVDVEGGVWEHMEIQKPIGDEENMNASSTHLYLSSKINLEVLVHVHMSGRGKVIKQKRIIVKMVINSFCEYLTYENVLSWVSSWDHSQRFSPL